MKQNGILKRYPESTSLKAGFLDGFSRVFYCDRKNALYATSNALKTWGYNICIDN